MVYIHSGMFIVERRDLVIRTLPLWSYCDKSGWGFIGCYIQQLSAKEN